jgi:hypothetical protein
MQEDWLRILIQGHALIERTLSEAMAEELDGQLPDELGSFQLSCGPTSPIQHPAAAASCSRGLRLPTRAMMPPFTAG